jgi:hypothetical protein
MSRRINHLEKSERRMHKVVYFLREDGIIDLSSPAAIIKAAGEQEKKQRRFQIFVYFL